MKQVAIKQLTLCGFKSFLQPTEVDLTTTAGLTLVAGDNQVEPRLGANGAGKSTLWDGLCFCLYGTSVRGGRIGDLVAHGDKTTAAEVDLQVDGEEVTIRREGPPARIYIGGMLSEQADVDRLVGLSRSRFLSSVVFGQAVPLFIDRSIPERGELLDEVLDLQLWMRAADLAGKRSTAVQGQVNELRITVGRTEGALSALEPDEAIAAEESVWEAERQVRVQKWAEDVASLSTLWEEQHQQEVVKWTEQHQARIEALLAEFEEKEVALAALPSVAEVTLPDLDALLKAGQEWQQRETEVSNRRAVAEQSHTQVLQDIAFFKQSGNCPICTQPITKEFADQHLAELRIRGEVLLAELKELDREGADIRTSNNEAQYAIHRAQQAAEQAKLDAALARAKLSQAKQELDGLEKRITAMGEETCPYLVQKNPHAGQKNPHLAEVNSHTARRQRVAAERSELGAKLSEQRAQEEQLAGRHAALEFWRQGFRRVRLYCIERALPQLDVEAMNAARQLGLIGWTIKHATETETKSGTQKLGVQITVESPTMAGQFSSWSGGEGQRVRLASALGFASLVQRWSGVRWGIEVFDEPTAFLSETGIEDLLDLLKSRADSSGRSIFISDHRGLQHSGFSRVMVVAKGEQGSFITA